MNARPLRLLPFIAALCRLTATSSFVPPVPSPQRCNPRAGSPTPTALSDMKRPILDRIATTLFRLETSRVDSSSVVDEKGREGEPMEWSEKGSLANGLSEVMAGPGYAFKQWVADVVSGEYDRAEVERKVEEFVRSDRVAMFSFSTCPFCRRAKDYLDERGITYVAMELDELEGNAGNEIRAVLGQKIRRTSVPSIFINGNFIGGCNDGPGLLPLAESGELDKMLTQGA
eukprot:CAMPEP_0183295882 /NCGR_PEP_ID=MMETSP0160_2-20130417/3665_1 /TAXON_ID=2839 ORGANISM="Odontella Sinensis, Strain Grunow 1884" /NCGR_SAMPLE_ID=MMETSP0160_2 /ASSEMBLY_ACC=CAM_ASM_000250 /LENGTH=228 /DNA_ID=CAMNT_0025457421 /DNA_START=82 /DNA_END=768 /DNA_ORIENTATION=-